MSRAWQALRALRLRLVGPAKELVGTDQFGNKYYRVPKYENRAGQIIPERRFVEAVNREAYQYQMGDFPAEWEVDFSCSKQQPDHPLSDAESKKKEAAPSPVLFLPENSRALPPPNFQPPPLCWSSTI